MGRAPLALKLVEEKAIQDVTERRIWADQQETGVKELDRNPKNEGHPIGSVG